MLRAFSASIRIAVLPRPCRCCTGVLVCAAVCVHLDASAPNFGIQEAIFQPGWMREIFPVQPEVERGSFVVSDRPGLGLEFDETAALRYSTDRFAELPHLRRDDGSVTDW